MESRYCHIHIRSIQFLQLCQDNWVRKGQSFQQMVLEELNGHSFINEDQFLSHIIHKSYPKVNHRHICIRLLEEKHKRRYLKLWNSWKYNILEHSKLKISVLQNINEKCHVLVESVNVYSFICLLIYLFTYVLHIHFTYEIYVDDI
jgi:hypothetical protein